jgi:hypothetical protein
MEKIISKRSFLDIPYQEHIVPFPNFASVLMQHARAFPEKPALDFGSVTHSYSELLKLCLSLDIPKNIVISMKQPENDLILLLASLSQGLPFKLDFSSQSTLDYDKLDRKKVDYHPFEPPYVRLDDIAFSLKDIFFSQYNVLVAAQAVGNAFKLFREGASYCSADIRSISDLVFGVLAPLYFAKSVYFTMVNEKNFFQYAWNGEINTNLRDSAVVTDKNNINDAYKLEKSFDQAVGLGPVKDPSGEYIKFLGVDIEKIGDKWDISGHCLGTIKYVAKLKKSPIL